MSFLELSFTGITRVGSEPFNPPKLIPNGTPPPSYPAGTLIPGNPPIASTVAMAGPGVTTASNRSSSTTFSNPSFVSFAKFNRAAFCTSPIPFVASAARKISWPKTSSSSCTTMIRIDSE
ncbi:hypothetical protein SDJN02_26660, partial [Cucurbita argyrosperma subsp. argyrosperma]